MPGSSSKIWRVADPAERVTVIPSTPLPNLAATLLANRGIVAPEAVEEFMNPDYQRHLHDPFLFLDMERVVERVFRAIDKHEAIVVYADYDADGVCSAALLTTTLRSLNGYVREVYMPHRETEGYGLNAPAVRRFIEEGAKLIITLD